MRNTSKQENNRVTFWHGIRSFACMKQILTACFLVPALFTKAGSPLTSTSFAHVYNHIPVIRQVLDNQTRIPGKEHFAFLDDTSVALDQKTALLNALGFGDSTRFDTYKLHISKKYGIPSATLDSILVFRGSRPTPYPGTEKISSDDLCCMGYFRALTDYRHPVTGYYCAYMAVDKNPGSMAASYIYGLILAEVYYTLDWCRLYESMQAIKSFDGFTTDSLSPQAVAAIFNHIDTYATSCKTDDQKIEAETPLYKKPEKRQPFRENSYVDLSVVEISDPEYTEKNPGSLVRVKIMNSGNTASIETNASLKDLDITVSDAKKRGIKGDALKVIKQNNVSARPDEKLTDFKNAYLKEGVDSDQDFEIFQRIPPIKPGEIITVTFMVKGIWVYDPNCELELKIDLDDNIEEKDEKNNVSYFITRG